MTSPSITPRILAPDDIAPDADAGAPGYAPPTRGRARRGIDYFELARAAQRRSERDALREALRAQATRPVRGTSGDPDDRAGGDRNLGAEDAVPGAEDDEDEDPDDGAIGDAAQARAQRADAQAAPFVAALGEAQLRVASLMHFVAAHVADFCSDDAVLANGRWDISLKLDDALLPGCVLHLSLSHFDLTLRFEADSHSTRQLLSQHAHLLKEQLTNLLRRLDTPRDVSIETV